MSRLGRGIVALVMSSVLLLLVGAPSYADDQFLTPDSGGGIPGWFVGWIVVVVVVGVATTLWRVSTAQKLAKQSGLDPGLATQMTLLSDDGLDATYLASSLRQQPPPPSPTATPPTTAVRLEELASLLDRGLITQAEHDERRRAIIDAI